jgi:hypothetical protein
MGYGQIRLSKGVIWQKGKAPMTTGAFLILCINYSNLEITNLPTLKIYYFVCYVFVGDISTDLGA